MLHTILDSKVHGANMGPIWGRQGPGGLHVGPMNHAIRDTHECHSCGQNHYNSYYRAVLSISFPDHPIFRKILRRTSHTKSTNVSKSAKLNIYTLWFISSYLHPNIALTNPHFIITVPLEILAGSKNVKFKIRKCMWKLRHTLADLVHSNPHSGACEPWENN